MRWATGESTPSISENRPVPWSFPPRFFPSCEKQGWQHRGLEKLPPGATEAQRSATLVDGKLLAAVLRIKVLWHLHCCRFAVLLRRIGSRVMMGVFAEFERAMIAERVRAGLARARSEGKRLGRARQFPRRSKSESVRRWRLLGGPVCASLPSESIPGQCSASAALSTARASPEQPLVRAEARSAPARHPSFGLPRCDSCASREEKFSRWDP
jgi:hypothetical protein